MDLLETFIRDFYNGKCDELLTELRYVRGSAFVKESCPASIRLRADGTLRLEILRTKKLMDIMWAAHPDSSDDEFWIEGTTRQSIIIRFPTLHQEDAVSLAGTGGMYYVFSCNYIECAYFNPNLIDEGQGLLIARLPELSPYSGGVINPIKDNTPLLECEESKAVIDFKVDDIWSVIRQNTGSTDIAIKAATYKEAHRRLYSLLNALSFFEGKRINPIGFKVFGGSNENYGDLYRLYSHSPSRERYYPPVSTNFVNAGYFLQLAVAVFENEANNPIVTAMNLWWNIADAEFRSRCLLACTVLTSIAKQCASDNKKNTEFADFINTAKEQLLKNLAIKNSKFWKRLKGSIESMQSTSDKDFLYLASKNLDVEILEKEIKVWKKMRNPLSHGEFEKPFRKGGIITFDHRELGYIANAINKLVLGLMRYKGSYVNYCSDQYDFGDLPKFSKSKTQSDA